LDCLYDGVCCDESVGVLMILAGLVYFRVVSVFRGGKRFVLYGLESKAVTTEHTEYTEKKYEMMMSRW